MQLSNDANIGNLIKGNFSSVTGPITLIVASLSLIAYLVFYFFEASITNTRYNVLESERVALQEEVSKLKTQLKQTSEREKNALQLIMIAPKTSTDLANTIKTQLPDYGVKLIKLTPTDSGKSDSAISLEATGDFVAIQSFLQALPSILSFSRIMEVKLTHLTDVKLLSLKLLIKFIPPTEVKLSWKEKEFLFDSAKNWHFSHAGFVPKQPNENDNSIQNTHPQIMSATVSSNAPENQNTGESGDALPTGEIEGNKTRALTPPITNNARRVDPFQVYDKAAAFEAQRTGIYLSGILYSDLKKYCVVTLKNGGTKVIGEGEDIPSFKGKIDRIERDHIIVNISPYAPTLNLMRKEAKDKTTTNDNNDLDNKNISENHMPESLKVPDSFKERRSAKNIRQKAPPTVGKPLSKITPPTKNALKKINLGDEIL